VNLRQTEITDAELVQLKRLSGLERLNLSETGITDQGLAHLDGLTGLKALDLSRTKITGHGLEHLRGLRELEFLYLGGTELADGDLESLYGFGNLRELDLTETDVTEDAIEELKRQVPGLVVTVATGRLLRRVVELETMAAAAQERIAVWDNFDALASQDARFEGIMDSFFREQSRQHLEELDTRRRFAAAEAFAGDKNGFVDWMHTPRFRLTIFPYDTPQKQSDSSNVDDPANSTKRLLRETGVR
jgi:hypothetical protein